MRYALEAAKEAREKNSLRVAEDQYRIALKGTGDTNHMLRTYVLLQLGEVLMLRGIYHEAEKIFEQILNFELGRMSQARAWSLKGELAFKQGNMREASISLENSLSVLNVAVPRSFGLPLAWQLIIQVVHSLRPHWTFRKTKPLSSQEKLKAHVLSRLAYAYWFGSGLLACAWAHLRGLNLCQRYSEGAELAQAMSEHGPVLTMIPAISRALCYVNQSLKIREKLGDIWGIGQSKHFLGVVYYCDSQYEKCIQSCEEAARTMRKAGDQWEVNTATWHIAYSYFRLGRLQDAVALARQVHEEAIRMGDRQSAAIAVSIWAKAAQGDIPLYVIEKARKDSVGDVHTTVESLQAQALYWLRLKNYSEAIQALREAIHLIDARGFQQEYVCAATPWYATALRLRIEAMNSYELRSAAPQLDEWKQAVKKSYKISKKYRNNLPHALREKGMFFAFLGRGETAYKLLSDSVSVAEAQKAVHERALSLLEIQRLAPIFGWEKSKTVSSASVISPTLTSSKESPNLYHQFQEILNFGNRLFSATDKTCLLGLAAEMTRELFYVDQLALVEMDTGTEEIRYKKLEPLSTWEEEIPFSWVREAVLRKEAFVLTEGSLSDIQSSESTFGGSLLGIPFVSGDRVSHIAFCFVSKLSRSFGENETRLSTFLARCVSSALMGFDRYQELLESRAHFRTIIDAAPHAMIVVDCEGKIVLLNQQVETLFSYSRDELMGRPVEMLIPDRYRAMHPAFRSHFAAHPEARPMGKGRDLFALKKDNTEFPVEIGLTPVKVKSEVFVIGAIVDISERKRIEAELTSQRDKLQESNEELERFAYVASHDLQEPLRAVRSWTQILKQQFASQMTDEARQALAFILRGGDRMAGLIHALLDYSRASRGSMETRRVSLKNLVQSAISNNSRLIEAAGARVELVGEFPLVEVSPVLFTQVFQNLIGNAIKFNKRQDPWVRVKVERFDEKNEYVVSVEDNGIGIDSKHQTRIFDVFKRLHTQEEYEGSGIGLSIVRRIVERHGGRIWLKSTLGQGSCFSFSIPIKI